MAPGVRPIISTDIPGLEPVWDELRPGEFNNSMVNEKLYNSCVIVIVYPPSFYIDRLVRVDGLYDYTLKNWSLWTVRVASYVEF